MPLNTNSTTVSAFLKAVIIFFNSIFYTNVFAQDIKEDTIKPIVLNEVIVKAFEQNKLLRNVPAAINYVGNQTLERFNNNSIVSAINTTAGVKMEERSPGSYRINIRGSSLRSPFGVRNVKVYYNDIPFTDPGGQTYLNGLGYYNFQSLEIIKGPGSSLYGAGTGGVMLIESFNENNEKGFFAEAGMGSFEYKNFYGSLKTGSDKALHKIGFQHQQSKGYRNQSASDRNIFEWSSNFSFNDRQKLKTTFLYSDVFYQTPGALTLSEFNQNPKQARPGSGIFPGAENAKAAIFQTSILAGASFTQNITSKLINTSSLYAAFTQLKNPAIRNYGRNNEPHVGGRTIFKWTENIQNGTIVFDAGAEMQQGFATYSIHNNVSGNEGALQSYDEVTNNQAFIFLQSTIETNSWIFSAGASINRLSIVYKRFSPVPLSLQKIKFKNEVAPRVSLLKKFNNISIYTSIAKGFSPPTIGELIPTGSAVNFNLNAEEGWNYDIGLKGYLFNKLSIDVNAFLFNLKNTIVQRRDAGGGDFFINAGKASQKGIETSLLLPVLQSQSFISKSHIWFSHTWHHFRYKNFKQLENDFSGNAIPGIAPHVISTGFDIAVTNGFYGNINYYSSDKIALSDANNEYANAYHLLGIKIGYELKLSKISFTISAGADNVLNERYSLGNDINAFGGRYYNAAPGRNYFVSLAFRSKKN